jgi:hypothetical protein
VWRAGEVMVWGVMALLLLLTTTTTTTMAKKKNRKNKKKMMMMLMMMIYDDGLGMMTTPVQTIPSRSPASSQNSAFCLSASFSLLSK